MAIAGLAAVCGVPGTAMVGSPADAGSTGRTAGTGTAGGQANTGGAGNAGSTGSAGNAGNVGNAGRTGSAAEAGSPRLRPGDLGYLRWPQPYERHPFSRAIGLLSVYSPAEQARFPCTASVIRSAGRNLLLTAAHCVRPPGPKQRGFTQMRFTPAYSAHVDAASGRNTETSAPYGVWKVRRAWVPEAWKRSTADVSDPEPPNRFSKDDIAVLRVASDHRGRRIEDVVGGFRPLPTRRASEYTWFTTLGYPFAREAGLLGNLLYSCTGGATSASPKVAPGALYTRECWVRAGHSGGPWLTGGTDDAAVFAVTSANMGRPGSLGARLHQATFRPIYTAAERWNGH